MGVATTGGTMAHPFSYEGRRAVVTGGSRGVGAALLDLLAELDVAHVTVLDLKATPLLQARTTHCAGIEEALFVLMTLGDDRAVRATYVGGHCVYDRDREAEFSYPTS